MGHANQYNLDLSLNDSATTFAKKIISDKLEFQYEIEIDGEISEKKYKRSKTLETLEMLINNSLLIENHLGTCNFDFSYEVAYTEVDYMYSYRKEDKIGNEREARIKLYEVLTRLYQLNKSKFYEIRLFYRDNYESTKKQNLDLNNKKGFTKTHFLIISVIVLLLWFIFG
tara:strand:- start:84 stop:593 length:510 start_codon:yes stop_codon:yes gene_type:complete